MRKKFLTGVTAVSAAIAICAACGVVSANAATLDKSKITVDSYSQKIYVDVTGTGDNTSTPGSGDEDKTPSEGDGGTKTQAEGGGETDSKTTATDQQILFGVSSVNKDKKIKTASWEVHDIKDASARYEDDEEKYVVIDISNLNTQKDNYMQIKGDASRDPITIFIPKTDKNVKMKFNPAKGIVENKNGSSESTKYTYEYRTEYGYWNTYGTYEKGISLKMYQEKGAKLYFRQSTEQMYNDDGDEITLAKAKAVSDLKDAAGTKLENAVEVASLPGKEVKVSIPKKANAPKASVNYVKQTIVIPANTEYRINDNSSLGAWTDASSKTTFGGTGTAIDPKIFKGGSLEVRKKATETKAESKTYQISFNAKEALTTTYKDDNATVDGQKADSVVSASYKEGTDKNKTKTLEIVNASTTDAYEVIVSATEPKVGVKGAKVVKKGQTVKIKNPTADAFVWIHKVGDNKNAIWSTDYVKMGKVVLPAGSGTENPGEEAKVTEADLKTLAGDIFESEINLAETSGTTGEVVKIGKGGTAFDFTKTDFEITVTEGNKKPIKGVKISVKSVSNEGTTNNKKILDESDTSDGVKYGGDISSADLVMSSAKVSATITVTYGEGENAITYDHTISFVYQAA